jgi:HEAT repeat protein
VRSAAAIVTTVLAWAVACAPSDEDRYRVRLDLASTIAQLGAEEEVDVDEAIERLASLGDAAVPAIAKAIAEEPRPIAVAAIEALGHMESPAADAALVAVATRHADAETRATALLKLGAGERREAGPVLEAALFDASPMVSHTAALACGALCTKPASIDRIVDLGLGAIPDTELGRLRGTLMALHAGPDPAAAAHARDTVRRRTAAVLGGAASLDARTRAALLAADAGATDVEPVLLEAAARAESAALRMAAIQWLGRTGSAAAVPVLQARLQDRSTAIGALLALRAAAERGVPGAREALDASAAAGAGRT